MTDSDDLWESVKIGLEIDEPDKEKRKEMAEKAISKLVERMPENIIEDYHIIEKPVVNLVSDEQDASPDTPQKSGSGPPTAVEYSKNRGFVPRVNNITDAFEHGDELVRRHDTVKWVVGLLSEVASKALTFVTSTIIKDVDGSIEEQEKAIEAIHNEEYEEAVDILGDNIQWLMERQDMWKLHMEEVADENVEKLREEVEEL